MSTNGTCVSHCIVPFSQKGTGALHPLTTAPRFHDTVLVVVALVVALVLLLVLLLIVLLTIIAMLLM